MSTLKVIGLTKKYPKFTLDNVSFELESGKITGFIGRNGAGKSTTLKSMLNLVHPDSGKIEFFGLGFAENENDIKQRLGFVSGGVNYYPNKKLKDISETTKRFYKSWSDEAYRKYMQMFALDETKTPHELSEGMKVKYSLVLALSHNAELLILDEPTSGLDPVSRDELLEVFLGLAKDGITIFFSTHITSDLDKCADNIIYIKNGHIIASGNCDDFVNSYKVAEFTTQEPPAEYRGKLIGCDLNKHGCTALITAENSESCGFKTIPADLEAIMVHMEKE